MIRRILLALTALFTIHAHAAVISAQDDGLLGLYKADNFSTLQLAQPCKSCQTDLQKSNPQALWYFRHELIAIPHVSTTVAGYSQAAYVQNDIALNALPPLVWLGSHQVISQAIISADGQKIALDSSETLDFGVVDKISTNLSYWNDSTLQFFKQRDVRLRGKIVDGKFIARTVWPLDFKLDLNAKTQSLGENESLKSLVQFEQGGAKSTYESRLLWGNASNSNGKAVLAFMLNGAQGDDDEAHGGHFAVVTGRMEADGNYAKWIVNNYYNLASNSEKGIIAAPTPMDNYLADVNSGQSYYRPSYMLVAVLKNERVPTQFQAETNRVYNHFYRNDFVYDHSRDNCAGISMDTLKTLGWNVPVRGATSQLKAIGAYFYVSATDKSLVNGRAAYDYLNTETTRLFPAVAFDAIGNDLFKRLLNPASKVMQNGNLEQQLKQDIEAIYFVRIPQIPSSRAFGQAPVYGFDQYMTQAPADRNQWKIVPTTPNPLPIALKDGLALKLKKPSLVPWPVALVLILFITALVWWVRKLRK